MKPLKTNHILNYFFPCWKTIGNKLTVNYCSQVSPTKIPVFPSQKDKFCIIATNDTCNVCTVAVEIPVQTLSWLLLNVAPGARRGTCPMWCGRFTLRVSTASLREGSGRCPTPALKQDLLSTSNGQCIKKQVHIVKAMIFFPIVMYDVRDGLWRRLSAKALVFSYCGAGEDSWESRGWQEDQTSQSQMISTLNIH